MEFYMKDAEDEAFDDLTRKQGSWGSGYQAKRKMAADKLQEPFGYFKAEPFGWTDCAETDEGARALYEAPPQRTWVGLTEEDFSTINQSCLTKLQAATSAESILKEKNS
jgi:hypothetical protein